MNVKRVCEIHGEYDAEVVNILGKEIASKCPECEKLQEAKEAAENQAEREKLRFEDMEERGIEPEFFGASLENYKAENATERDALEAAKALAKGEITKLLLLGSNGVGKTHLADALALMLGGVRITMFELSARIRASYKEGSFESELGILNKLLTYKFIALDEIGRTKGSDSEKNWLSYLIDKAHTRGIRLLLVSNRHSARNLPVERQGEAIEFYFDNDVISRLRQGSKIVEVSGRDRRSTLARA